MTREKIISWLCMNIKTHRLDGEVISMVSSSAVDCAFDRCSSETKEYKIGIWCFSAKHKSLMRKSRLVGSVSKGSELSTHGMSVVSVS